jgi:hypothetical protein
MKLAGKILLSVLVVAIVLVAVQAFGMWMYGWALPWQMKIERQAVKQSQSFVNSQNDALQTFITTYGGLEIQRTQAKTAGDTDTATAITSQEKMILSQMCHQMANMNQDTISSYAKSFVASHGGCQ